MTDQTDPRWTAVQQQFAALQEHYARKYPEEHAARLAQQALEDAERARHQAIFEATPLWRRRLKRMAGVCQYEVQRYVRGVWRALRGQALEDYGD